jgi:hypothetical protein
VGTIPAGPDRNIADRSSFSRHMIRLSLPDRIHSPPLESTACPPLEHVSTGLIITDN